MIVVLLILLAIAMCHLVCIHSKKIHEMIALKISNIASRITTSIVRLLTSNSKIFVLGGITTQVTHDEIDEKNSYSSPVVPV